MFRERTHTDRGRNIVVTENGLEDTLENLTRRSEVRTWKEKVRHEVSNHFTC